MANSTQLGLALATWIFVAPAGCRESTPPQDESKCLDELDLDLCSRALSAGANFGLGVRVTAALAAAKNEAKLAQWADRLEGLDEADARHQLGKLVLNDDPSLGLAELTRAQALFEVEGDLSTAARINHRIFRYHYFRNELLAAFTAEARAHAQAQRTTNHEVRAKALSGLIGVLSTAGDTAAAAAVAEAASRDVEPDDHECLALIENARAMDLAARGHPRRAVGALARAQRLARDDNVSANVWGAFVALGR